MYAVRQLIDDIRTLRIQGATNVAYAVLDALTESIRSVPEISHDELERIGLSLAYARPNEPLAQNAVRYVFSGKEERIPDRIHEYRTFIEKADIEIPAIGRDLCVDGGSYMTVCHSMTTVRLFTSARAAGAYFSLYVAETRPRFQGRTTARDLLRAGFDDVTMVIDDVAVSLLEGRRGKIDALFVGADLLTHTGFVNKVGTLALAAAAARKRIPVYVVSSLLKYDPMPFSPSSIEVRDPDEVWDDPPAGLKIYAPAFDYVPFSAHMRVVCESGIISGTLVSRKAEERYPFIEGYSRLPMQYGKSV